MITWLENFFWGRCNNTDISLMEHLHKNHLMFSYSGFFFSLKFFHIILLQIFSIYLISFSEIFINFSYQPVLIGKIVNSGKVYRNREKNYIPLRKIVSIIETVVKPARSSKLRNR